MSFFDGFTLEHIDVGDVVLRLRHGGSGPPVVLGHHMAEEAPAELAAVLRGFFAR